MKLIAVSWLIILKLYVTGLFSNILYYFILCIVFCILVCFYLVFSL